MGGLYEYIITYGAYGDGTGRNAGICALGEAWGYHIGYFLTIQEFGTYNSVISKNGFENFDPIQVPNKKDIKGYGSPIYRWEGWIPGGIMLDITDTGRDLVRYGYYDNVSGYSIRNIFNALDSDVRSPRQFRDRLLKENYGRDRADVLTLFEAYYWN